MTFLVIQEVFRGALQDERLCGCTISPYVTRWSRCNSSLNEKRQSVGHLPTERNQWMTIECWGIPQKRPTHCEASVQHRRRGLPDRASPPAKAIAAVVVSAFSAYSAGAPKKPTSGLIHKYSHDSTFNTNARTNSRYTLRKLSYAHSMNKLQPSTFDK